MKRQGITPFPFTQVRKTPKECKAYFLHFPPMNSIQTSFNRF
jgi:hypothetical protein